MPWLMLGTKQSEKMKLQLVIKDPKGFQRLAGCWRMQGNSWFLRVSFKSSQNAKLQESREWSFSVWWLWFPRVQMTENFPYVVCLKPFNQMVNLFMLNDTFCNFANWHVSGDWRVQSWSIWAGHRLSKTFANAVLCCWRIAVLVFTYLKLIANFQVLAFWSMIVV